VVSLAGCTRPVELTGPAGPGAGGGAGVGATGLPAHDGPVVLITLGGLRADSLRPELTPHLAALAAEADWSGRAVAASSWSLPALGTLTTGLDPWLHGMVTSEPAAGGSTAPRPGNGPDTGRRAAALGWEAGFPTLGEAVGAHGYEMSTYLSGGFLRRSPLAPRALGTVRPLRRGAFAEGHLRSLGEPGSRRRQLLWVQLEEPALPYERRGAGPAGRVAGAALPPSLSAADLEAWNRAPGAPTREQRATLGAMYRLEAARADARLGAFLAALRASPAWEETLLLVTALHGAPVGAGAAPGGDAVEGGDAVPGGDRLGRSLGRGMLEVPLVVKLPRALRQAGATLAEPPGGLVAQGRVWSTLVEAVGGRPAPAAPPGLFRAAPTAALSELHLENGINEISLVEASAGEETWQLLWRARFAAPEAGFAAARAADFAAADGVDGAAADAAYEARTGEAPEDLFRRLRTAYEAAPPLSGPPGSQPHLTLLRWTAAGGAERVEDPERAAAMARRLRRHWLAFQTCERPPAAEAAHRAALRTGGLAMAGGPDSGSATSFAARADSLPTR